MAFVTDQSELKPGLVLFWRGDVEHRMWYCRMKMPKADRYKTVSLRTCPKTERVTSEGLCRIDFVVLLWFMYPSDLTDAQWLKLEPLLKEPRGDRHAGGRPRKHELRRVVDAMLYLVKTGCQWRQLPVDSPPWKSVHEQFRAWRASGVWERVGQTLREQGRKAQGRNATPSVAIVDSQSAKTALKGGGAVMTRARKSRGASGTSQ